MYVGQVQQFRAANAIDGEIVGKYTNMLVPHFETSFSLRLSESKKIVEWVMKEKKKKTLYYTTKTHTIGFLIILIVS